MPILVKKLFVSFLLFLTVFMSVAPSLSYVKAQAGTWYNSGFFDWYSKVYDEEVSPSSEIFGERYTAAQVQWVVYSLLALPLNMIVGTSKDVATCVTALTAPSVTNALNCATNTTTFILNMINTLELSSLIADSGEPNSQLANKIFNTNDRSISGIKYVQNLSVNLSPVSKVNAQGYGYRQLNGVQVFWTGFRNMAYSIVVLITIIFAFMVMFKVKLNPQTVVSVQSALPKIIMAVILATFSFAIAGFVIDLSYVVAGIFASLLNMAGFSSSITGAYDGIIPSYSSITGSFTIFWYMLGYTILMLFAVLWSILSIALQGAIIFSFFGTLVSIVFLLLVVWVLILTIWYAIKIPWVLIKNLISLYMSIVVAPLQIILGSLVPSMGFDQWLKKIISEVLVFPVTGAFMYLAWKMLLNSFAINAVELGYRWSSPSAQQLWSPQIIGSASSMSGLLWIAASFSLIALLPKVVDMMKALVMGERFSFGNAMQEAVGTFSTAYQRTLGEPVNAYMDAIKYQGMHDVLSDPRFGNLISKIPYLGKVQKEVQKIAEERARRAG